MSDPKIPIPVRTSITVLRNDNPEARFIGFRIYERMGRVGYTAGFFRDVIVPQLLRGEPVEWLRGWRWARRIRWGTPRVFRMRES